MSSILGISAYYHDSAAALVVDGDVVAAAQEERFSRLRHDPGFPASAIRYVLEEGGVSLKSIDQIVFYDKPLLKFERLLETYLAIAPRGIGSFITAMPIWLKEKLFLKTTLRRELATLASIDPSSLPPLLFTEHHQSHAASAFYPSPFKEAAVLCLDGVGEWATTSLWHGKGDQLVPLWQIDFPHSLGLLYSAFTYHAGFKVNSGEYKLMGLAPYGEPTYQQLILDHLIDLRTDGTFRLNMDYFNYLTGLTMTNDRFSSLFDGPPRKPESEVTRREMDLACSIQRVTEEVVMRLAATARRESGASSLALAGGVALNCVSNGKLLRSGLFDRIWIQPAAGDAGGALGAALAGWHHYLGHPRRADGVSDQMKGGYLGPSFSSDEAAVTLKQLGASFQRIDDDSELVERVAAALAEGAVVGWFQGRMEFGPRALGGRSILGDPRSEQMQSRMNLKIKFRESFRPFAPSVLRERVGDYFMMTEESPYMLLVTDVDEQHRLDVDDEGLFGIERLQRIRSTLPAITHVDHSARVQTVDGRYNQRYYQLLRAFERKSGCPMVVNTSFNVRGEPIVATPADAWRCFMRTGIDLLVVENLLLEKSKQPQLDEDQSWMEEFALD